MSEQAPPDLMRELWADALDVAVRDAREPLPEEHFDRARGMLEEHGLPARPEDVLLAVGFAAGRMSQSSTLASLLTRGERLHGSLAAAASLIAELLERPGYKAREVDIALLRSIRKTLEGGPR